MNSSFSGMKRPSEPQLGLFKLPAELREAIFKLVVISKDPFCTHRLDERNKSWLQIACPPAITRVSRQIRSESLPLYYSCNRFKIRTEGPKFHEASEWLECIGKHVNALRHLMFDIRCDRINETTKHGHFRWLEIIMKPQTLDGEADSLVVHFRQTMVNKSIVVRGPMTISKS